MLWFPVLARQGLSELWLQFGRAAPIARLAATKLCHSRVGFSGSEWQNHPGLMARSARAELTDRPLDWPDFPRSASRNSRPRNSRKRILFVVRDRKRRNVAFWSIDTPISVHGLSDAVPLSPEGHGSLASRATVRLNLEPQDVVEPREGHLHAARLVQQHRFDGGPFLIIDLVTHDSMLLAACYCPTVLLAHSFRYPSAVQ
jgi:hypothetical protein